MINLSKVKAEVEILKQGFKVELSRWEGKVFIVIRDYPLPSNWSKRNSDILIVLKENYPSVPPIVFVEDGLKIKCESGNGWGVFHSFDGFPEYKEKGWAWLCFSLSWSPSSDGVITFLEKFDYALKNIHGEC